MGRNGLPPGAATGDRFAGLLAAVSGGVWFDFFLTEPYLRFTIEDRDDIETTRELKAAANALEIELHDHVVIGHGKHASFRSLGLL